MSSASAEDDAILKTSIAAEVMDTTTETLRVASDEAKLHLGSHGLKTRVVDVANVLMLSVAVGPGAFRAVPDGSYTVGTNLQSLQDYTGKADADQTVDFRYRHRERKLDVRYNGYDIDMACIDPDSIRAEPDMPELDLPNHITAEADAVADALEVCALASDHVIIKCDADAETVTFIGEGDTDTVDVTLDADDFERHHIREDTKALFSLAYLVGGGSRSKTPLLDAIPSGEVTLTLGDELPMRVEWDYADGDAEIDAILAPRIQSN